MGALTAPLYFFVFVVYYVAMNIITIPKELFRKGDLVVLPKKDYEALLKSRNDTISHRQKSRKTSVR